MSHQNERKPLILIGGGGHCRSCIDVIQMSQAFEIKGILDHSLSVGTLVNGIPVLGDDNRIREFASECLFLITVGNFGVSPVRKRIWEQLEAFKVRFATVISPLAHVASTATVEPGSIVMHHALVNSNAQIGMNCIINTGSVVEHDCRVQDHTHVAVRATLLGGVAVGSESFIGANAVIKQNIQIASRVTVGAQTFVLENILKDDSLVVGIPGKLRK